MIQKETLRKVAELAGIPLEAHEEERFVMQLNSILECFKVLDEPEAENEDPAAHSLEMFGPLREDGVKPSLSCDEMMKNTANKDEGYYTVPRVLR